MNSHKVLRLMKNSKKAFFYLENFSEATTACLIAMVQGHLLVLGLSHWIIASQTGIIAATIATAAIVLSNTDKRWLVSLLLGVATAVVDYLVHPGMIDWFVGEAVLTGVGAACLSYTVGSIIHIISRRRNKAKDNGLVHEGSELEP
jgi:homospermidine synthase